ncbi:MAG: HAMP domain-containing protein [Burkholderiales bacterium]|nr:HAMP domain-containing protein [Burkholderiales bacterium]
MRLLARLKLSQRLALGFGLVLALLVLTTAYALLRMQSLAATLDEVAVRGAARMQAIGAMERAANDYALTLRSAGGAGMDQAEALLARLAAAGQHYDQAARALHELMPPGAQTKPLLDAAAAGSAGLREVMAVVNKAADGRGLAAQMLNLRAEVTGADAAKWTSRQQAWAEALAALGDWDARVNREHSAAAGSAAQSARLWVVAGALVALVIGAFTAWRLTRDIGRGLREAVQATERMARHDLSQPVVSARHDELGQLAQALESMRSSLHGLAGGVRQACQGIASASGQITQGSHDLSQRTEQTAATLQATSSAIAQLIAMLDQTLHTAGSAGTLAREAQAVANRGGSVVNEAVSTMQEIDGASRRIADIIAMIDGIAFQTNILALNAAVEAARAGEQGRGFAVVAGEVRALAQRSASAAREIKGLIQASLDKVHSGSAQVRNAGGATDEIMRSVARVAELVGTLSAEAAQQRSGVGEAGRSVAELDTVAQQNAALAEQSAAAASSLLEQARRLSGLVDRFRLDAREPGSDVEAAAPA